MYHEEVSDKQRRDEQGVFRDEELHRDVSEECQPSFACVSVDECDEEIGDVHDEAGCREDDQENSGDEHRPADLSFSTSAAAIQVVPTHTEETNEDTCKMERAEVR